MFFCTKTSLGASCKGVSEEGLQDFCGSAQQKHSNFAENSKAAVDSATPLT